MNYFSITKRTFIIRNLKHTKYFNNVQLPINQKCMLKSHFFSTASLIFNKSEPSKHRNGTDNTNTEQYALLKQHSLEIFHRALEAVSPKAMVQKALIREDDVLHVNKRQFKLNRNVHLVAVGKAVLGMVRAAEDILGEHLVSGLASVPVGIQDALRQSEKSDLLLPSLESKVKVLEGARGNIPDEQSLKSSRRIEDLAKSLKEDDLLLVLLSGGASALLPSPKPPISLEDLAEVTRLMGKSGSTIYQLNMVRNQLEILKGGGLAEASDPAKVITLILSDVVGDRLDVVGSGPTVPNLSSAKQCIDLLEKFNIINQIPQPALDLLSARATAEKEEQDRLQHGSRQSEELSKSTLSLNGDDSGQPRTLNILVGSNTMAILAATIAAEEMGYLPYVLSSQMTGEAAALGRLYAKLGRFLGNKLSIDNTVRMSTSELELVKLGIKKVQINEMLGVARRAYNSGRPMCIIGGGETTVRVRGSGLGGRNIEAALAAAIEMSEAITAVSGTNSVGSSGYALQLLSSGTDGLDGPTPAAGALADPRLVQEALSCKNAPLDAQKYLDENDSFTFYSNVNNGADLVMTGHTGTNVMDLQVLLIDVLR